jgi:hypothetical protein
MKGKKIKDNVIEIFSGSFLSELDRDLETAVAWSEHKYHLLWLVASFMKRKDRSPILKNRALKILMKHSDVAAAVSQSFNNNLIVIADNKKISL